MAVGGRTLAGDTAESCECSVIDTRFRVYSGQARAASLAETVGTTTPAFLLRRVYYVSNMSWALSADVNRDRFNFLSDARKIFEAVFQPVARLTKHCQGTIGGRR